MIPQIKAIQDASFEEKMLLVQRGMAYIASDGKVFLSLDAVDNLGQQVLKANPLVQVGDYCQQHHLDCTPAADVYAENAVLLEDACNNLFSVLLTSVTQGLPLYQSFKHFMAWKDTEGKEDPVPKPDYMAMLRSWKEFSETVKKQQMATATASASAPEAPAAPTVN